MFSPNDHFRYPIVFTEQYEIMINKFLPESISSLGGHLQSFLINVKRGGEFSLFACQLLTFVDYHQSDIESVFFFCTSLRSSNEADRQLHTSLFNLCQSLLQGDLFSHISVKHKRLETIGKLFKQWEKRNSVWSFFTAIFRDAKKL